MGIVDLLKDIPLSAVLKEKILSLESENGALKSENSILKIQLNQTEEKIRNLEKQLSHNSNPHGYVSTQAQGGVP